MNTLTYLSRQFDVLASPRPSSHSSSSPASPAVASDSPLKRVATWSASSDISFSLRRSHSSPSFHSSASPSSSSRPRRPSRPSSRKPSISAQNRIPSRTRRRASFLRRVVLVRILLSLWNYLYDLWKSITRHYAIAIAHQPSLDDGSSEDDKDTEDEAKLSLLNAQPPSPLLVPTQLPPILPHPPLLPFLLPASSDVSRTPTPPSLQRKVPLLRPRTLVLDLDETLIHSTSRPIPYSGGGLLSSFGFAKRNRASGYTVEVMTGGQPTVYHVYKRPFVDYFLRKVSAWYTLVIFTASMREYADPVIDWLDAGRGILERRFFRESCTQLPNGSYTKDLSIVEDDLSLICLVDNSPVCYTMNEANGIPIEGWTHDPHDEALLDLLPFLDSLRFTKDVRRVLGIRGFPSAS